MTATWSADAYGSNLGHHRVYDDDLLASLGLRGDERVLDLGCGVGDVAHALARAVPDGSVTAVDADPDMVRAASQRSAPNLQVEQVRAQDVGSRFGADAFDVVVSVAVLHWVPVADQAAVAEGVAHVLVPGGRFRADFGGRGQIAAARTLLDEVAVAHGGSPAAWYFPSVDEHRPLLDAAGLDTSDPGWIRRLEQRRPFDEDGVRGWLASQVSIAYLPGVPAPERADFLDDVEKIVLPGLRRADGTYDQDYVRIDLLATAGKPS
ncbi:class I SAM-dependent methyltransferase [Jatrophihabitans sp. YIM 134969]